MEIFDARRGQIGDEVVPMSDAGINKHIEFSVGKLLVKSHACFGNDACRELDMLLRILGGKSIL